MMLLKYVMVIEYYTQAELRRTEYYSIEKIQERPQQKTDRDGGFGSTGT